MATMNSLKRVQINKANSNMVIMVAVAAFIVTFSAIASRALLAKRGYQAKVIKVKENAVKQLDANIQATQNLVTSYKAFVGTSSNVIGGNPTGKGDKDGDNAKITLDALPSKYDFPALTSSVEKVLAQNNYKVDSITGVDDEVAQTSTDTTNTAAIPMPFALTTTTSLEGARNLLVIFEKSIRPIQVKAFEVSGGNSNLQLTITAQTYYLQEKGLSIKLEDVK